MQKHLTLLCVLVLAYTLFYINLPPWWDGATTAITAMDTAKAGMDPYQDFFGKPPLIFLLLGILFKIFGYSTILIHIVMLAFSLAAIIFTYKVGETLSGKQVALAASSLLAISPLFIAQSINLNFDMSAMAFIMASFYFFLKKNHVNYAISASMLLMTKEVGILFITAVLSSTALEFVSDKRHSVDYKKVFAAQVIPVLIFILWAYGNFTRRGWFIFPRDSPILKIEPILNEHLLMRLEQLFVINFNWILTLIIIVSGIVWISGLRKKPDWFKMEPLMPMILFTLFFFITVAPIRDFNLPRYLIVLCPSLYLASSSSVLSLSGKNKKIFWGVIFSIIALFAAQTAYTSAPFVFLDPATQKIYGTNSGTTLGGSEVMEINLKYVDYVQADMELVSFLNTMNSTAPLILNRFNHYCIFKAANKGIDIGYGQKSGREYIELNKFYESPNKVKLPAILILEDFNKYDMLKLYDMYNVSFVKNISFRGARVSVFWINN